MEVRIKNGRLTEIRQDQDHPLGMLCRRGEHAPEIIYSESRLRQPLMRRGKKGTYNFEPVSWEKAYQQIVNHFQNIIKETGSQSLAIYTGRGAFELSLCDHFQPKGVAVSSASSVLFPLGTPNTMGVGALCYVSFAMIAPHVTMGRMYINMFSDLENAEMVVVWGANPATDSPPLDMRRLEAAVARGTSVVVIDPRKTETVLLTGAEWIPIRPGTDGALALGLIEVLIEEDLLDEEFAEKWCVGFAELRQYVQHFSPEIVETITRVPAQTIRELARKIANARGCAPVMYTGLEYSNSGVQAIRGVLTLWALAGQLDVPGGLCLAMPKSRFPINREHNVASPEMTKSVTNHFPLYSAYRGELHASSLVSAVLQNDPYPIHGLIMHGASLLTSWPQTSIWRETLSKLKFLVCINRNLTADSAYADLILPATTMFEIDSYMVYGPLFRLREKLIEPLGEARNDYRIMAELAQRLGYGHLYPQNEEVMIRAALKESGFTLEQVKEAGGLVKIETPVMEYRKWEKGILRLDGALGFDTPSGKFEIHSTILEDYGYQPLPKYIEPSEGPLANPLMTREYPLILNTGARLQTDFRSQHHEIAGLVRDQPEPCVEIHRQDACPRGINTGDRVNVKTSRGEVGFRAIVTEQIISGTVECNMGGGSPDALGGWKETNVNELTDLSNYDEISGFPVYKALLCEVKKLDSIISPKCDLVFNNQPDISKYQCRSDKPSTSVYAKRNIDLDANATTSIIREVREAMQPFLEADYGNPSSLHRRGRIAKEAIEKARRSVAFLIGARPKEIIFTSGGTEANNLALQGITFSQFRRGNHLITSRVEHPAVLRTCQYLEKQGMRVSYLEVDSKGRTTPENLEKILDTETILVSIMLANNEVGTIQPVAELCHLAHQKGALFHTDAIQAVGKIPVNLHSLPVDLLSLSAHKMGGPKGIGALYVKKGVQLEPLLQGGGQESGMRSGTEAVSNIVGLGRAADLAATQRLPQEKQLASLCDKLEQGISKLIPGALRNGSPEHCLPNTLNMTFPGIRGESLVIAFDRQGIAISAGSACKSGSPEPSHVLLAMGRSNSEAHCSVRFSLPYDCTEKYIEETLFSFALIVREMESTVRFLPCR